MKTRELPIGQVICADAIEGMQSLPSDCGVLAIVDGPYNLRKAEWDKFASWDEFREFYRPLWAALSEVLRDNCSLYVFGTFESLAALKPDLDGLGDGWRYRQCCVWDKGMGFIAGNTSHTLRMMPIRTELCLVFTRARVHLPTLAWDDVTRDENTIRAYINAERERAGLSIEDVIVAWQDRTGTKGKMGGHWFWSSQWSFPTRENYQWLRDLFNERGPVNGQYLHREYEDLRCTFNQEQGVTDVWEVPICAGVERIKVNGETAHVAQKPLEIMRCIVRASSDEGDLVLVPFSGVGSAEVACAELRRRYIGFEFDEGYCEIARRRLSSVQVAIPL